MYYSVAKTKRDLPAPTQKEPLTPLKNKWDFTGPWTTSATIDFSLLNLDSPPPVEETTSWYDQVETTNQHTEEQLWDSVLTDMDLK